MDRVLVAAAESKRLKSARLSGSICYWDEGHSVGYMEIPGLRQKVLVEVKHCDQKPALGWSIEASLVRAEDNELQARIKKIQTKLFNRRPSSFYCRS